MERGRGGPSSAVPLLSPFSACLHLSPGPIPSFHAQTSLSASSPARAPSLHRDPAPPGSPPQAAARLCSLAVSPPPPSPPSLPLSFRPRRTPSSPLTCFPPQPTLRYPVPSGFPSPHPRLCPALTPPAPGSCPRPSVCVCPSAASQFCPHRVPPAYPGPAPSQLPPGVRLHRLQNPGFSPSAVIWRASHHLPHLPFLVQFVATQTCPKPLACRWALLLCLGRPRTLKALCAHCGRIHLYPFLHV